MTKRTTRKKSMFVADIVKDNKEVEKTSYEAENHSNEFEDMTVSTETSQLSQIEVEEVTVHRYSNSTLYRTKPNPIREYYHKVLMNERFYHGYLPLKDATEILKYQPSGHFLVHVTNECGFLNPVVVSVKHYADVIHHTLEVGVTGKCYTTKRMFETVSHIIEHHVQTGQFLDDSINFRLIAPANFCDWQIKTENVMIMKNVIGTGCFSNVSFALYIDNGKCIEAAVKCPKEVAEVDTVGMMYTEHRLLQHLDCPYIIKPFGVTVFTEIPMMVMEYANGGSLLNYRDQQNNCLLMKHFTCSNRLTRIVVYLCWCN